MLETVRSVSLLASRNPGSAPDEHRSRTQPNDWTCDEPPQECDARLAYLRVPKGQRSFRPVEQPDRANSSNADFRRRLYTGAFSPWSPHHFDREFRQFLNHHRIRATVGSAEVRRAQVWIARSVGILNELLRPRKASTLKLVYRRVIGSAGSLQPV